MQHIVIQTANPEPLLHEDGWAFNGIGRKFSHKFGYGLMDASAMVDVALNWPGVSSQRECLSPMMKPNISIHFRLETIFGLCLLVKYEARINKNF